MAKTVNVYKVSIGVSSLVKDHFLVQAEDLIEAAKKGEKLNELAEDEVVKVEYVGELRA